uniref:glutathione transferase n=1 Tax=Monodelphis domestica TaxID=13616 RepID=A0A5F8GVY7_MONDO
MLPCPLPVFKGKNCRFDSCPSHESPPSSLLPSLLSELGVWTALLFSVESRLQKGQLLSLVPSQLAAFCCFSENQELKIMSGKPILHYFNGRGRMESVRWLLAAAGVEFEEKILKSAEDFENLVKGGNLMYQQVPMVEIDGLNLVQTRAILKYIAAKYNLYGKDLKEKALIDMYVEGMRDLNEMIMHYPLCYPGEEEKNLNFILERATERFFPVYEKALKSHGKNYLVGNQMSWADIQLFEAILMVEELKSDILSAFPKLQEFKARISKLPRIQKFLQPGSQRKPPMDDQAVEEATKIFNLEKGLYVKHKGVILADF